MSEPTSPAGPTTAVGPETHAGPVTTNQHPALDELIATVARLRGPGGCPWDAEQTHDSLVQYLIEECWELVDAIETGTRDDLIEELGDVLYQVLFHSDLAASTSGEFFTIEDVAQRMNTKMVSRHPHVFGDRKADTPDEVMSFWDELKADEKPHRTSVLDGIPRGMPALALAAKVIGKANKIGVRVAPLDGGNSYVVVGPDVGDADSRAGDVFANEEALGQHLLCLVAKSREQGLDAERALRGAIRGFEDKVRSAEQ